MWRNYVICVLIGLLLATSVSSVTLLRQSTAVQSDADRLRQRAVAAESTTPSLQQQIDRSQAAAATPAAQTVSTVPAGPRATPVAAPAPAVGVIGPDSPILQQIEDNVATLRGLQPKSPVSVRLLDQSALQRMYVDRFNHDYLPDERESDQKLLSTLGLIGPNDNVVQILLDVLQEQLLFPYADGFNFIRQIYQTSGYAGVDAVFRDPPQSTAQVLHIDKYRNHVAPVEVDLPDLSQGALGDGWRKVNSNVFGELDLRLMLTQLTDSTQGVRGAGGWAGDRWELLEKDGHQAFAIKSVWDSEADATTFFRTFSQAMQNRYFGARVEEASDARQALTATSAATEVRRRAATVVAVISFDRDTAQSIADAIAD